MDGESSTVKQELVIADSYESAMEQFRRISTTYISSVYSDEERAAALPAREEEEA